MRTRQFEAATIRDLLKAQKIATLEDMKAALGTQAPATVFRKLSELKHFHQLFAWCALLHAGTDRPIRC